MKKRALTVIAVLALSAVLVSVSNAALFSNMYVYGDSLSDNGNLYDWTAQPNPVTGGNPIPVSPPYSAGRFQDGPTYAELLWNSLGLSGSLTPRGLEPFPSPIVPTTAPAPAGTNYAVGGARSRYHVFDVDQATQLPPTADPSDFRAFSLLGQYEQYQVDLGGGPVDADALYVVWSGSNDLQDVLTLAGSGNPAGAFARLDQAIVDTAYVINDLVGLGARNLLIPNLPDLGLVPAVAAQGPQAVAAGSFFSAQFNAGLDAALADLSGVPELELWRYDTFGFLRDAVSDPGPLGLTNTTAPCLSNFYVTGPLGPGPVSTCPNPDQYLFWDIVHPTARTHEILAAEMRALIPVPASLLLFGLGLAGLAMVRHHRAPASSIGDTNAPPQSRQVSTSMQ
jgi:phospholipase/lecithinase/hemolysin